MTAIEFNELEVGASILEEELDTVVRLGLNSNGLRMSKQEFRAVEDRDELYRYELIRGVVIVQSFHGAAERAANGQLGYRLLQYGDTQPDASKIDATLYTQEVDVGDSIRAVDRAIWTGLGRHPDPNVDPPTIAIDFVSAASATRGRDYRNKRHDYANLGVKEYWIIDRFRRPCPSAKVWRSRSSSKRRKPAPRRCCLVSN